MMAFSFPILISMRYIFLLFQIIDFGRSSFLQDARDHVDETHSSGRRRDARDEGRRSTLESEEGVGRIEGDIAVQEDLVEEGEVQEDVGEVQKPRFGFRLCNRKFVASGENTNNINFSSSSSTSSRVSNSCSSSRVCQEKPSLARVKATEDFASDHDANHDAVDDTTLADRRDDVFSSSTVQVHEEVNCKLTSLETDNIYHTLEATTDLAGSPRRKQSSEKGDGNEESSFRVDEQLQSSDRDFDLSRFRMLFESLPDFASVWYELGRCQLGDWSSTSISSTLRAQCTSTNPSASSNSSTYLQDTRGGSSSCSNICSTTPTGSAELQQKRDQQNDPDSTTTTTSGRSAQVEVRDDQDAHENVQQDEKLLLFPLLSKKRRFSARDCFEKAIALSSGNVPEYWLALAEVGGGWVLLQNSPCDQSAGMKNSSNEEFKSDAAPTAEDSTTSRQQFQYPIQCIAKALSLNDRLISAYELLGANNQSICTGTSICTNTGVAPLPRVDSRLFSHASCAFCMQPSLVYQRRLTVPPPVAPSSRHARQFPWSQETACSNNSRGVYSLSPTYVLELEVFLS